MKANIVRGAKASFRFSVICGYGATVFLTEQSPRIKCTRAVHSKTTRCIVVMKEERVSLKCAVKTRC